MNLTNNCALMYLLSQCQSCYLLTNRQKETSENKGLRVFSDSSYQLNLKSCFLDKNTKESTPYKNILNTTQTPLLAGEESLLIGYSLLLIGKVAFSPLPFLEKQTIPSTNNLLDDKTTPSPKTFLGDKTTPPQINHLVEETGHPQQNLLGNKTIPSTNYFLADKSTGLQTNFLAEKVNPLQINSLADKTIKTITSPINLLADKTTSASPMSLCLDLGTQTGWALLSRKKVIASGSKNLKGDRFQGGGMRFLKFVSFLGERLDYAAGQLKIVFFEAVRRHLGVDAAHAYGGFLGHLTAWCEQRAIAYEGVPVGTIKRHATGKGNASKAMVIESIVRRGHKPIDDNEADAPPLAYWALDNRLRGL